MRRIIVILLLLTTVGAQAQAQSEVRGDTIFYSSMPKFGGDGVNAFARWMGANVKYPEELRETGQYIGGRVVVKCIINTDGSMSDFEVLMSPHDALSRAVVRTMRGSPKWKPGVNGPVVLKDGTVIAEAQAVRVGITVPVNFTIPGTPSTVQKFTGHIYNYGEVDTPPAFEEEGTLADWMGERVSQSKRLNKIPACEVGLIFVIEPDKSLSGVRVINAPNNTVKKELERILADMPRRKPGMHGGQVVRTQVAMMIRIGTEE